MPTCKKWKAEHQSGAPLGGAAICAVWVNSLHACIHILVCVARLHDQHVSGMHFDERLLQSHPSKGFAGNASVDTCTPIAWMLPKCGEGHLACTADGINDGT